MIRYIEIRSCGRYSYVSNEGCTYTLWDNELQKTITLKKQMILQEMERPTYSRILPLLKKGVYTRKKRQKEILIDYITCHFLVGDEFRISDLHIEDLSYMQIRQVLCGKYMKGVEFLGNGLFRYIGGMRCQEEYPPKQK